MRAFAFFLPSGATNDIEGSDALHDLVCLETSDSFVGLGRWYKGFRQTADDEVRQLLHDATVLRLVPGTPTDVGMIERRSTPSSGHELAALQPRPPRGQGVEQAAVVRDEYH